MATTSSKRHKLVIGRSEPLDFVDFNLLSIPAKTDTGAYRSAVHASNIKLDEQTGILSFDLLAGHPVFGAFSQHVETGHFRLVNVENSFGHCEDRYEVKLRVKLGLKTVNAEFTLANRSKKKFPILLGRKLLNRRFIVDTSLTGIDVAKLKRDHKINFPIDEEEKYVAGEEAMS